MNAMGIAIDDSNNIYIADMESHQIIKFNSTGSILSMFNATFSAPRISSTPQDVAVDTKGNIYVADTYGGRIVQLNSAGHQLSAFEISGVPVGIAVKNDKIYVTDLGNNRVDVFLLSQFVNNGIGTSSSTQRKEIPLDQNSTALDAAIKLATSAPQFQSLVKGYNYTFSSDFEESGPLSTGGIGLTDHGFAFELYSGPVNPGKAVKVVEVFEDPALAKILNVTSYSAGYNPGGPMIPSTTLVHPSEYNSQNNTLLLPLEQFKSGIAAKDVKCKEGLQIIIKNENGQPACVTPYTFDELRVRGWGIMLLDKIPTYNNPDFYISISYNGTQLSNDKTFYVKQGQNVTLMLDVISDPANMPVTLYTAPHSGFTKTNGIDFKLSDTRVNTPTKVMLYMSVSKDATPTTYGGTVKGNTTYYGSATYLFFVTVK